MDQCDSDRIVHICIIQPWPIGVKGQSVLAAPADRRQQGHSAAFPWDRCLTLLAVSEAIVSHRDLSALFHELAGRLHQVVRFDYLALLLHEAENNTLRLHVLEPPDPAAAPVSLAVGETPARLVWQTQQ